MASEAKSVLTSIVRLLQGAYNISQLSRDSGISRPYLHKVKTGTIDVGIETAEQILDALGYELVVRKKDNW